MIELNENMEGRKYRIKLIDGHEVVGECVHYIPDKDNIPEIDSVWIENSEGETEEIFLTDIKALFRIV